MEEDNAIIIMIIKQPPVSVIYVVFVMHGCGLSEMPRGWICTVCGKPFSVSPISKINGNKICVILLKSGPVDVMELVMELKK